MAVTANREERIQTIGRELLGAITSEGRLQAASSLLSGRAVQRRLLTRAVHDPHFKTQLFRFIDVYPSLRDSGDLVRHLREYLSDRGEIPPPLDRLLASGAAKRLPSWAVARLTDRAMQRMAKGLIGGRDAEDALPTLRRLRKCGTNFTVDILGEAVLSESEAAGYARRYRELIDSLAPRVAIWSADPSLDSSPAGKESRLNLSIKISSFYSQIDPADFEGSRRALLARLKPLLVKARRAGAFINIDVERNAHRPLTFALFEDLAWADELRDYPHLGVVVQAYLRDSQEDLLRVIELGKRRQTPLTVRLVKGAYWDYETVIAAQEHWPCPVFMNKAETDAQFERLAEKMVENWEWVHPALGTHNIRSLAAGLAAAEEVGLEPRAVELQFLHGVAEPIRRAAVACGYRVREYVPTGELIPGMAYLVRRLLETTSNESFLRLLFAQQRDPEQLIAPPLGVSPVTAAVGAGAAEAADGADSAGEGGVPGEASGVQIPAAEAEASAAEAEASRLGFLAPPHEAPGAPEDAGPAGEESTADEDGGTGAEPASGVTEPAAASTPEVSAAPPESSSEVAEAPPESGPEAAQRPGMEPVASQAAQQPWQTETRSLRPFQNEPHADFSQVEMRTEMEKALATIHGSLGRDYGLVIDGTSVWTEPTIVSVNPARPDEIVGRVASAAGEHADRALETARSAFPAWRDTHARERAAALLRAAEIMRQQRFELAALEVVEAGKPWREADADVTEAIDFLEYYAREMLRLYRAKELSDIPGEDDLYFYEPRGVAVVIAPWNFPLAIPTGMVSAALVAGNTVVFKPANPTPVIGYALVRILHEAGIPAGALHFLPGPGGEIGGYLAGDPRVDLIAFTGSLEVGLSIMQKAAVAAPGQRNLKKVIAELGGKNAIIVDTDADLDAAVEGVIVSAFHYGGQKCSACSRVIVMDEVYDQFVHRLTEAAASLKIGDPAEPGTRVGPVITAEAREGILEYVEKGKAEARLLYPPAGVASIPLPPSEASGEARAPSPTGEAPAEAAEGPVEAAEAPAQAAEGPVEAGEVGGAATEALSTAEEVATVAAVEAPEEPDEGRPATDAGAYHREADTEAQKAEGATAPTSSSDQAETGASAGTGEEAGPEPGYFLLPHVFVDVPPDAVIAQEEIFGPVLAVFKVKRFADALELALGVRYGLTGGLYSRNPAHIRRICDEYRVGNLYINRPITGAMVGRQPFGGSRMSGVGSKAGGPDYLLQFMEPRTVTENTLRRGFAPQRDD